MSNPSKAKGTKFETECVLWLRERLNDKRIERRALHGNRDMGDLYGIYAHGLTGIAECKDVKCVTESLLRHWQRQTIDERYNADADFALLIVHRGGVGAKRFGLNWCFVTFGDCLKIDGHARFTDGLTVEQTDGIWLQLSLEDACRCMEGRGND